MTCGPVSTHLWPSPGTVPHGSVLLASEPPASMYMKPTLLAGGSLCAIHASAHFSALASMHIGSAPGVCGLLGMQVQPFWPSRSTFIVPSALAWTIVAPPAIAFGAAAIALSIGSLGWAEAALAWALLSALSATFSFWQPPSASAPAASSKVHFDPVMTPLHSWFGQAAHS